MPKDADMQHLSFIDPGTVLSRLRWVEENLPIEELPEKVRTLRTHETRPFLEMRQAALFFYGLSIAMRTDIRFAMREIADYDALASFERDGKRVLAAVQLKEVVPETLNAQTSFQKELDKLKKYADSKELVVAFHLNRRCTLDLSKLAPPQGVVAEIWVVAATNEEMTEWALIGNVLNAECHTYKFVYPDAESPYESEERH